MSPLSLITRRLIEPIVINGIPPPERPSDLKTHGVHSEYSESWWDFSFSLPACRGVQRAGKQEKQIPRIELPIESRMPATPTGFTHTMFQPLRTQTRERFTCSTDSMVIISFFPGF